MLYFDYLNSNGSLITIDHFKDCVFLLFFTRNKCKPCKLLMERMRLINLYHLVPVIISMDNSIQEWYNCFKLENWLLAPYFPIEYRKKCFKDFKVYTLPFLTIYNQNNQFNIPKELHNNINEIQNYIDFAISCIDNEEYEII